MALPSPESEPASSSSAAGAAADARQPPRPRPADASASGRRLSPAASLAKPPLRPCGSLPRRWVHKHVRFRQNKRPGFCASLSAEARLPLPAGAVYELLTHERADAVLSSLGRCTRRLVTFDDGGGRQVVEVEQETTCSFLWFSGTVRTPLRIEQDAGALTVRFTLSSAAAGSGSGGEGLQGSSDSSSDGGGGEGGGGCSHLATLEGRWTILPAGPQSCTLRVEQAVQPRGLPPLLGGAVRSFVAGQVRQNYVDLFAEVMRVRAGQPTLPLTSLGGPAGPSAGRRQQQGGAGQEAAQPVEEAAPPAASSDKPSSDMYSPAASPVDDAPASSTSGTAAAASHDAGTASSSPSACELRQRQLRLLAVRAAFSPLPKAGPGAGIGERDPASVLDPPFASSASTSTATASLPGGLTGSSGGGSSGPSGGSGSGGSNLSASPAASCELQSPFAAWSCTAFGSRPDGEMLAASAAAWPASHRLRRRPRGSGGQAAAAPGTSERSGAGHPPSATALIVPPALLPVAPAAQALHLASWVHLLPVAATLWLLALALPLLAGAAASPF